MDRNCWYCNKSLSLKKLLSRARFCSVEHEKAYLSEQSLIAMARIKALTPAEGSDGSGAPAPTQAPASDQEAAVRAAETVESEAPETI